MFATTSSLQPETLSVKGTSGQSPASRKRLWNTTTNLEEPSAATALPLPWCSFPPFWADRLLPREGIPRPAPNPNR
eukprot:652399-Rhodomonas_salina.1